MTVDEVTEFRTAVAGVEIDWVRVDRGWGPAFMVSSGDEKVVVSSGGLDFSTLLNTEAPADRIGFQLVTRAPAGMRWCGSEAADMELRMYRPTASIMANVPAGSRAVTAVAWLDPAVDTADALGLGELRFPTGNERLPLTPQVRAFDNDLLHIAAAPELLEAPTGTIRLLESAVRAIASLRGITAPTAQRGFDSRGIVAACLNHVAVTCEHQPTISELCRVAHASESRLRQAFVEVLGVPPVQFFQLRVLSMLRDELLRSGPSETTVTTTAMSLGLTQLGRVAGRYRRMFGELPSETLHRHVRRSF